jgi:hypothetical protein
MSPKIIEAMYKTYFTYQQMKGMIMGSWKNLLFITLCVGLIESCGQKPVENQYKHMPYFHADVVPSMVYVGNQVNSLNTNGQLPLDRKLFAEVRTREGHQKTGRILQITDRNLILSTGYYNLSSIDTTAVVENRMIIPKKEILILKIW